VGENLDFEVGKILSKEDSIELVVDDVQTNPFIVSSPHSGSYYPEKFVSQSILSIQELRRSEDCYVDEILYPIAELGVSMIAAKLPRSFVDVNRFPYELDEKMFSDPLPDYVNCETRRVRSGFGTIPKLINQGLEIYAHKLKFEEEKYRIEEYYNEYHKKLGWLIENAKNEFGRAIVFDFHSMPSDSACLQEDGWLIEPDIVIGDNKGRSCSPDLILKIERFLENKGVRTARNKPYSGGFITTNYGKPQDGCSVVQFEINRRIYMNEATFEKKSELQDLCIIIKEMFENLIVSV
jgi:N-formylglutamate amidohydrolase